MDTPGRKNPMEYTEQQRLSFLNIFSERRKRQLTVSLPMIAVVFAVMFTEDRGSNAILGIPANVVGPLFLGLVLAVLVFTLRNWRCPACEKYLGRSFNPRHCQNCGIQLRS